MNYNSPDTFPDLDVETVIQDHEYEMMTLDFWQRMADRHPNIPFPRQIANLLRERLGLNPPEIGISFNYYGFYEWDPYVKMMGFYPADGGPVHWAILPNHTAIDWATPRFTVDRDNLRNWVDLRQKFRDWYLGHPESPSWNKPMLRQVKDILLLCSTERDENGDVVYGTQAMEYSPTGSYGKETT